MYDDDDRDEWALRAALQELLSLSGKLPDPEMGLWRFVEMLVAVLLHQQMPGRPLSWTMLLCARRVNADLRQAL